MIFLIYVSIQFTSTFLRIFFIHVHREYWRKFSLGVVALTGFGIRVILSNIGSVERLLLLSLSLKSFEKYWLLFFENLVEFSWESVWTWAVLTGRVLLLIYTSLLFKVLLKLLISSGLRLEVQLNLEVCPFLLSFLM